METLKHSTKAWQSAKSEIVAVLAKCARLQRTISYSELVAQIRAIDLQPHDPRRDELLGQISTEEHIKGRGMLSVLVVHKSGDQRPGPGFFECAHALGLNASDKDRLWVEQFKKVTESW